METTPEDSEDPTSNETSNPTPPASVVRPLPSSVQTHFETTIDTTARAFANSYDSDDVSAELKTMQLISRQRNNNDTHTNANPMDEVMIQTLKFLNLLSSTLNQPF